MVNRERESASVSVEGLFWQVLVEIRLLLQLPVGNTQTSAAHTQNT